MSKNRHNLAAAMLYAAGTAAAYAAVSASRPAAAPPIAVVELFTAEGCSSCPPADGLLADLAASARKSGARIFPLAFHVDYWDHLGWKDPFGRPEHSARQRRYAETLGLPGVYTPQMIVNGRVELLGSDRAKADKTIRAALARPAQHRLWVSIKDGRGSVRVHCIVSRTAPLDARLCVALVERGRVSRVKAGENAGRTLRHENVVRAFREQAIRDGRAGVELPLPVTLIRERASVIAFLQDPTTMQVLAADQADLPVSATRPAGARPATRQTGH